MESEKSHDESGIEGVERQFRLMQWMIIIVLIVPLVTETTTTSDIILLWLLIRSSHGRIEGVTIGL